MSEPKKDFNETAKPLEGKNVVFTGKLDAVKRRQARAIAREVGATARFNVSGKTDYVVAGKNAGKNLQEAANRKVKIVSEDDFFDMVRQQRAANKAQKQKGPLG